MADVNSARVANTASTSAYLFPRSWCMRSSLSTSSALKGVAWVTMVAAINTSPGGVASVSQLAITPGDGPQPRSGLRTLANSSVLRPRRSRADATWARASAAMSGRYPDVAAADPTVVGRLVAARPPAGLSMSYELLMQQHGARGGPGLRTVRPGAVQPLDGGTPR